MLNEWKCTKKNFERNRIMKEIHEMGGKVENIKEFMFIYYDFVNINYNKILTNYIRQGEEPKNMWENKLIIVKF